jgi:hypothetical protein
MGRFLQNVFTSNRALKGGETTKSLGMMKHLKRVASSAPRSFPAQARAQVIDQSFFTRPILNSPYANPAQHWELDATGQPTNRIIEKRRIAEFITPIPKPKKRKQAAQQDLVFNEGRGRDSAG